MKHTTNYKQLIARHMLDPVSDLNFISSIGKSHSLWSVTFQSGEVIKLGLKTQEASTFYIKYRRSNKNDWTREIGEHIRSHLT